MQSKLAPFKIQFVHDGKKYTAKVEQTYLSDSLEIFTVTGGKKSIQFQSNRPLLRSKGLNKRKINWKALNAKVNYQSVIELIRDQIESYIRNIEHPPFDWNDHPKNAETKKS